CSCCSRSASTSPAGAGEPSISRASAHDALESDDAPEAVEGPGECVVQRGRAADAWLKMEGLPDQRVLLPLRLQVRAADDPVAPEEREHVVAVAPLRRRLFPARSAVLNQHPG